MAWIELHQSLFDHRKTLAAADALDLPEVHLVGHLASLWSWCLDNAPDGTLPESKRIIARGARWTGDAEAFVAALVSANFIADVDGSLVIVNWEQYGGKLIEKRKENAAKQARYRERHKDDQVTSPSPEEHVTVTLPSRNHLEKSREEKTTEYEKLPTGDAPQAATIPKPEPKQASAPKTSGKSPALSAAQQLFNRRRPNVDAYFRGIEVDPASIGANQRFNQALKALTPAILDSPECTPDIIEPLTRYAVAAYRWRDGNATPSLAEVLKAFPEWDKAGRPEQPAPKVTPIRSSGRASPPMVERGNVPPDGGLAEWRAAGQRTENLR